MIEVSEAKIPQGNLAKVAEAMTCPYNRDLFIEKNESSTADAVDRFNDELEKAGMSSFISLNKEESLKEVRQRTVAGDCDMEPIYKETIRNTIKLVLSILMPGQNPIQENSAIKNHEVLPFKMEVLNVLNNIAFIMPMQAGKTLVSLSSMKFLCLFARLVLNKKVACICLIPNDKGLESQYKEDNLKLQIMDSLSFSKGNNSNKLFQFNSNIRTFRCARGEQSKECSKYIEKACHDYDHVVVFIDEADFGTAREGVLMKMLQEASATSHQRVSFVLSSGTNYDGIAKCKSIDKKRNWIEVRGWVGHKYVGPTAFNGDHIPTYIGHKSIHPNVQELNTYGFNDFLLKASAFSKISNFIKLRENLEKAIEKENTAKFRVSVSEAQDFLDTSMGSHETYRAEFVATLAGLILDILPQKKTGIIVRANEIERCKDLVSMLGETLPNIKVYEHNSLVTMDDGQKATDLSLKEFIAKKTADHSESFVIVIAGSGRRADSFPAECNRFIDLNSCSGPTHASDLQGSFGRLCGYGKFDPLMICCSRKVEDIQEHLQGKNTKRTSDRTDGGKHGQYVGYATTKNIEVISSMAKRGHRGAKRYVVIWTKLRNIEAVNLESKRLVINNTEKFGKHYAYVTGRPQNSIDILEIYTKELRQLLMEYPDLFVENFSERIELLDVHPIIFDRNAKKSIKGASLALTTLSQLRATALENFKCGKDYDSPYIPNRTDESMVAPISATVSRRNIGLAGNEEAYRRQGQKLRERSFIEKKDISRGMTRGTLPQISMQLGVTVTECQGKTVVDPINLTVPIRKMLQTVGSQGPTRFVSYKKPEHKGKESCFNDIQ